MYTPCINRSIGVMLCLLVAVTACGSDDPSTDTGSTTPLPGPASTTSFDTVPDPTQPDPSASTTTTDTAPATSGATTGVATTTAPSTDAPTTAPAAHGPIADAVAVAATPNGVVVDPGDDSWDDVVLDDTSIGNPRLVDGLVVYQASDPDDVDVLQPVGPILVTDGGTVREFTDGERAVELFDVGHVDDRAVALATTSVAMPAGRDDAEERLVLVDLETFETTDIATYGGFEDGVSDGRFVADAIAVVRSINTANTLQVFADDGSLRNEMDLQTDTNLALMDFDESVWVLATTFTTGDLIAQVLFTQVDSSSGEVREATLTLQPDGLEIPAGFCAVPDFLDDRMVCDQSDGPPLSIDIDSGVATAVDGLDDGRVFFRASQ